MKIKYIFASVASAALLAVGVLGGTPGQTSSANGAVRSSESSSHKVAKKSAVKKSKVVATSTAKKDHKQQDAKKASADSASSASSNSASQASASSQSGQSNQNANATSASSAANNAGSNTTNTANQSNTATASTTAQSTQASQAQAPTPTTGFTVGGSTYAIRSFSGSGSVPADSYVYQWTGMSNHYLFERTGVAFGSLASAGVGSTVAVNGHQYTIRQVLYNQNNTTDAAYNALMAGKAQWGGISFQTCEATNGFVRLYFAN